ncbi:type IX secretion system membrane protein PorP/SprF [Belliella sp. DSM 111904]|uniref:Type IX secretion system membrane protein PorP/SprF n=1 Tax=Belliella filtrata TaxID=2923435 RepID=A0ABS9V084_9BACT|nr:type IX secretion system membrane protein PorP/SprF [Belliella filtrata]MCH7409816.1 type IX secretion system membrane protein PorP/SprF [Belliella filtrata]
MRKFKFLILIGLICSLSMESKGQQVPQFSQYMFNPLFINPAYTGYKEQLYVQSYYRKQWAGVEGSPETFALGADGFLPNQRLGVGLVGLTDRLGAQRTNAIYGNIAYHLRLGEENYLSFGMGIGFVNSMLDGAQLIPGTDNDPSVPGAKNTVNYPDLKLGMFYYASKFYAGLAVDNVTSPLFDLDNGEVIIEPRSHLNVTAGYWIDFSYAVAFKPSVMYMDDFKAPARLDVNASFIFFDKFWLGASYRTAVNYKDQAFNEAMRNNTAVVGLFEVFIGEGLRVGYAYDHQINGFNPRGFSTHDISIGYLFPPKRIKSISPRNF